MMRFQWNALRPGDSVLVHDPSDPGLRVVRGDVVIVECHPGETNSVAIRFDEGDGPVTLRPRRMWVHFDTADAPDYCWRCASSQAAA